MINRRRRLIGNVLPPNMLRRITIREMLLATAFAALVVVMIRDRWMPNPLDAYVGLRIDQYLISEAAREVDNSSALIKGNLTGGFAGGRMLHQGYAILECHSAERDTVVASIKDRIREQFKDTGWQYVENYSTSEDWQISAFNNGSMSQLIFQFVSPETANNHYKTTQRLGVQWAELGFSKKWRLEL